MQARVSSGGLTASEGLFWEKELISVLTLYWCLVTVVKYGPVCSLPQKHNHLLSHDHTQTHIWAYLGNCKVETRGRKATEASCGFVFSAPSLFYISAVLVTGIIIIKWLLGMKHSDHLGKKLYGKYMSCTIHISAVKLAIEENLPLCLSMQKHCQIIMLMYVIYLQICRSVQCSCAAPSSKPLTIHCNHCVFSVIFRVLAHMRPLYDIVNFNCLGLSI